MSTAIQPIIEIHNLNVTYAIGRHQEVQALKNISLSIYPGEFIIFFGPSGCGKSTALVLINKIYKSTF
jgi:ABC-type Fe3+/spermidine/putrescine transport system ATPase subunit